MKKWWFHTAACVCNGVLATAVLVFFIYEMINTSTPFTFNDGLGTFVVLLGYTIYIVSDIWGIRLYYRYKTLDTVSYTDTGKAQVILFFLLLVQVFIGYVSFVVIRRFILDFPSVDRISSFWDILGYLIVMVFFTAIIVFIGFILLMSAIKKNKAIIKKEIEKIGKTDLAVE